MKQTLGSKPSSTLDSPDNQMDTNDLSDYDEMIPSHWYGGSPGSEPSRFTFVRDITNDSIEAPSNIIPTTSEITPYAAGNADPSDPSHNLPDGADNLEGSNSLEAAETVDPSHDLPDTTNSPGNSNSLDVERMNLISDAAEERGHSSAESDLHISHESSNDDSYNELPIRHSTRTRKPPDQFQYAKPGHPVKDTIQSLFHGLTTAFTYVLTDPEVPSVDTQQFPYGTSVLQLALC